MEKRCNLCLEVKPLTAFYRQGKSPDGVGYTCKTCSRARSRRWNQDNPERARESQRAYWSRHAEKKNADRRQRTAADEDYQTRRAEQRRRYYESHREDDLRRSKAWRESPAGQAWKAEYLERTRARRRAVYVKRTYGIDPDVYAQILADQRGLCAICQEAPDSTWHVDHDHTCCPGTTSCGKCIRGLLCSKCNHGLGRFQDDPDRLIAAAAYINKYRRT